MTASLPPSLPHGKDSPKVGDMGPCPSLPACPGPLPSKQGGSPAASVSIIYLLVPGVSWSRALPPRSAGSPEWQRQV